MIDSISLFVFDVLNHPEIAALAFAAALSCVAIVYALVSESERVD